MIMSTAHDGTVLVEAILSGDRAALSATLAPEPAFNSPIRRYERRDHVLHLLGLLSTAMPGARVERVWPGPSGAATVISAELDEGRLDGVIEERWDGAGQVREVTLMLRPHSVMMPAIKRMAAALEREPMPA
jgi:hypothetical protein